MQIRIVGPRDTVSNKEKLVNTTSHSQTWTRDLSPFHLGPIPLYSGKSALRMENAWQYAKVYSEHLTKDGNPSPSYWEWAESGWANSSAVRYPKGKGAKPVFLLWDTQHLDYIEARLQVYWRLYRDSVRLTEGFSRLRNLANAGPVTLFDFDGRDLDLKQEPLSVALLDPLRPMGHAFVLKSMLLYGELVEPDEVIEATKPLVLF